MSWYNSKRINKETLTFLDGDVDDREGDPYRYLQMINDDYYFLILPRSMYINDEILVTINFNDSNYPFGPPKKILVNGINYRTILAPNNIIQEFLNKFTDIRCLCCSTLMCKNNWSPRKTIKDILEEIVKNLSIRRRTVEYIFAKKITQKYFGFYLPIEEFI